MFTYKCEVTLTTTKSMDVGDFKATSADEAGQTAIAWARQKPMSKFNIHEHKWAAKVKTPESHVLEIPDDSNKTLIKHDKPRDAITKLLTILKTTTERLEASHEAALRAIDIAAERARSRRQHLTFLSEELTAMAHNTLALAKEPTP